MPDASQSAGALGRKFGLSNRRRGGGSSGCRRRGDQGASVWSGRETLGFGVTVFLGVKLATKGRVSLEDFERAVRAIPEVQTVEHVLGLYDYRLRVVARDLPILNGCCAGGS